MSTLIKITVAGALCFCLAGCSQYIQADWYSAGEVPNSTPDQVPEDKGTENQVDLQKGQQIRLTLATGDKVECRYLSSNTEEITVSVMTIEYANDKMVAEQENADYTLRTYAWRDITNVEWFFKQRNATGYIVTGGLLVVALGVLAIGASFGSTMSF